MSASQEHLATKADLNALGGRLSWMVLTCFLTQLGVTLAAAALLYTRLGK